MNNFIDKNHNRKGFNARCNIMGIVGFLIPFIVGALLWWMAIYARKPLFPPIIFIALGALGTILFGPKIWRVMRQIEKIENEWREREKRIPYSISERIIGAFIIILIGAIIIILISFDNHMPILLLISAGLVVIMLSVLLGGPVGRHLLFGDITMRTLRRLNDDLLISMETLPPEHNHLAILKQQISSLENICIIECKKYTSSPNANDPFEGAIVRLNKGILREPGSLSNTTVVDIAGYKWCLIAAEREVGNEHKNWEPCLLAATWNGVDWEPTGLALPNNIQSAIKALYLRHEIIKKEMLSIRKMIGGKI